MKNNEKENKILNSIVELTKNKKKENNKNKQVMIVQGKALPNNGSCEHFKKSFRWFKFPCCSRSFPCDECHDKESDHPYQLASIQICGFCAKSFSIAKKECPSCSSSIVKKPSSHWEGGKGCRSTSLMSKDDKKKFSNTNKTTSNRAKKKKNKK